MSASSTPTPAPRTTPDAVVIGYGPVGAGLVDRLLESGARVRVLTRSGSGPATTERVRADVLDPDSVARAVGDAPVIHMAFHAPAYSAKVWADTLPGMERNVLDHARRTGATVVAPESLYAFDADGGPITAATPLRPRSRKGEVRKALLAARTASSVRIVSVVAGDFTGPRVLAAHAGDRLLEPLLAGRTLRPVGDPDLPHAFTHVPDLARAMIAASALAGAGHEVVMAPSAGSITMRDLAGAMATAAGVEMPRVAPMSPALLHALGLVVPSLREIAEVAYQFTQPFEVDASAGEARLGVVATPWPQAARETVAWWRDRRAVLAS
ncbi:NAD-dependent epimerase/dehydratase family protein [Serinibacter arcticus]|uniref:Epimerase n=1 Tax=Serinibacter arcticus TaxID=1655435 RepID=A0A4Z1DWR9_9MICO|nr:NAD-dependent epimerase/dehydratase family protein [Serinibacter arcticus]TGO04006.1 epimerase [Serinibacter arcticus]